MPLRRSCDEDGEAAPRPVELRGGVGQTVSPRARQGVSTRQQRLPRQGPWKGLCVHAWPPLTRDGGVAVSLWLCLANSALTVDAPNPSKSPVEPSACTNTGLTEVLTEGISEC